jgi:hypothetical protein
MVSASSEKFVTIHKTDMCCVLNRNYQEDFTSNIAFDLLQAGNFSALSGLASKN